MTLSSAGITDGVIADIYGMRGSQQSGGVPTLSVPLSVSDAPEGTVCFAVSILDPDSVPLAGFEWVHWYAVNIKPAEIPENASLDLAADMVQGANDFGTTGYGGPTPPDKPHTYVITVYALDAELELSDGFAKAEFAPALEGHILAEASIEGSYSN
jgi:Raf kinase inhibitor-like YbhB/YbcL family protein